LIYLLLGPLVLFLAAGRWNWWPAWVYLAVTYSAIIGGRLLVLHKNPEMLKERAQSLTDSSVKSWDRVLVPILTLLGPSLINLIAGLDERFNWSPDLSTVVEIAGFAGVLLGSALSTWAFVENQFFSAHVRIQKNRGHRVISSGPYRIIRHPGYAGGLLLTLFAPLLLGSLWAFLPVLIVLATFLLRTALEDRALQDELPGYTQYAAHTRYKLIPGVW
jgi:protein-S-isoprenylcysteine O-methyltransferase Ste14